MKINESAPIIAVGEVEVAADANVVWDVIASIDRWPDWNPDIKAVSLKGDLAVGSSFSWRAGPGTITSIIIQLQKPQIIAWNGSTQDRGKWNELDVRWTFAFFDPGLHL